MTRLALLFLLLTAPIARAAPPQVVADIAPVHSLVAQVMDGVAVPALLVPPGASPHDHAMRPSEARALSGAEVVIWIGPDLIPALNDRIPTMAPGARSFPLLEQPQTEGLPIREIADFGGKGHNQDHEGEHEGDHGHGHEHDHGHDGTDPHAWLDPVNAGIWLSLIAEVLSDADPANAARYRANADSARADLDRLTEEIQQTLGSARTGAHIVFHDAFQYFEHRFALPAAGAIALSDASDPSPARIAALRTRIAETDVTCMLSEPQFNADLANTVFEGTSVNRAVIDPLGTDLTPGPSLYPALMRAVARTLTACRQSSPTAG